MNSHESRMPICYAVRGRDDDLQIRIDPFYNLPEHRSLISRILGGKHRAVSVSDKSVVVDIFEGRITPRSDQYSSNPNHPVFLRAQNIEEGYLRFDDCKRLPPKIFASDKKSILRENDVVLTIDGALLGIAAVFHASDEASCISNHMVRLICGTDIVPDYLAWFLNSELGQSQIRRGITGSAIPGLRTDAIRRIVLPVPGKEKQRRFVGYLQNALERRARKREEADILLDELDQYIQNSIGVGVNSIVSRLSFGIRRVDLDGPMNPARYRSLPQKRQIDGGSIFDVATILEKKVTPSVLAPDDEWDLIRIDDLPKEPLEVSTIRTVLGQEALGSYYEVIQNDILVARLGPTIQNRKFVLCPKNIRRTIASPEFLVLRCKAKWDPLLVLWILRTSFYRDLMYSQCRGATPSRYRVNRDDLSDLPFPQLTRQKRSSLIVSIRDTLTKVMRLLKQVDSDWEKAKIHFVNELVDGEGK